MKILTSGQDLPSDHFPVTTSQLCTLQSPDVATFADVATFRNADRALHQRHNMAHILNRVLKHRTDFFRALQAVSTPGEVKAESGLFAHQLSCWLDTLESAVMQGPSSSKDQGNDLRQEPRPCFKLSLIHI